MSLSTQNGFKHAFVSIWLKSIAFTLEELVLELNPVKSNSVESTLEAVHAHQD